MEDVRRSHNIRTSDRVRTSGKYMRRGVSYNARGRTRGNAYVAEDTYSTGRCTSSKCTYARKVRMSSEGTYATGRRTSSRMSLEYESRILITESVVGVSLTESVVGTRLFAQTSDGPKCPRMLPKQYHLETLR